MQRFASGLLALCGYALTSGNVLAQIDGAFIPQTPADRGGVAHEAPQFDSAYAAEERRASEGGNTPEADARPGTYYFMEGATAFRKKDYTFAIQMYEVSASWAYKPAEYNIAVMYARGQGVPVDLPRAMAWMALAAERNDQRYVDAREAVYAELTREQFAQANVIWRELKKTYADEVALRRAKARWAEVRAHMTGSRVGSAGNLQVGIPGSTSTNPSLFIMPGRAVPEAHPGLSPQNVKGDGVGFRTAGSTSAEVLGGVGMDGSIAYGQLLLSTDPYDPKFANPSIGTATVGKPTTVKNDGNTSEPAKG